MLRLAERHPVLRPPRAGERGLDRREVELDHLRVRRRLVRVVPERRSPCSTPRRARPAPPVVRSVAGSGSSPRPPGRTRTSRRTRATCSRSSRDRRAGAPRARARKYSTNFPTTPVSRRIWVTVRTRSVAVAPSGSAPMSLNPTTCGTSIEIASPSIAASASIPPTPQPSTPSPLIIVVCESVPTSVSGKATPSRSSTTRARNSRLTWWTMPVLGRDDLEVVERALPPAQERVALPVALELELGVSEDREPRRVLVDLDRVVDHELGRAQRVDPLGIASEIAHCVSHGREVDHRGHAREVLEEHATGREGDLLRGLGRRDPRRDRLDVVRGHVRAVLVPEHVLEQDAQRVGQAVHVEALLERSDAEDLELAPADRELAARAEAVGMAITLDSISLGPVPSLSSPRSVSVARADRSGARPPARTGGRRGSAYAAKPSSRTGFRSSVYGSSTCCRPTSRAELKNANPMPTETSSRLRSSRSASCDERGVHAGELRRAWQALSRPRAGRRASCLSAFDLERRDVDQARGRSARSLECGEQLVDGRELGVAGDARRRPSARRRVRRGRRAFRASRRPQRRAARAARSRRRRSSRARRRCRAPLRTASLPRRLLELARDRLRRPLDAADELDGDPKQVLRGRLVEAGAPDQAWKHELRRLVHRSADEAATARTSRSGSETRNAHGASHAASSSKAASATRAPTAIPPKAAKPSR